MKKLKISISNITSRVGLWWFLASLLVASLVLLPMASLVVQATQSSADLWSHLLTYVLPQALSDSALLLVGVGVIVIVIGTGTAWLVSAYNFPGCRIVDWALLMPLAIPTYIIAYVYLDLWHPVGTLQTGLREFLGYNSPREFRLPDIRSMWGCILLLGLVLYPYVYLPVRAAYRMQATAVIEVARTLGASPWKIFFSIALPLVRPAIAVGTSLALMEALNDIGASEFLGVRTLTVSIYSTWINRSSLAGASQIALFMLVIVIGLVVLERWARRKQQYASNARHVKPLVPRRLSGWSAWIACIVTFIPVVLGFAVPLIYLGIEAVKRIHFDGFDTAIIQEVFNTFKVAFSATIVATILAFILVSALRQAQRPLPKILVRIACLGYAVPGTVVALSLLKPIGWFDGIAGGWIEHFSGAPIGLILSGSTTVLVYAYVVRFLAIGSGTLEASFSKISYSIDDAAHSLGANKNKVAWQIYLPLSKQTLIAAMLLTFIDCVKELPATLLLRPINFETLATHLYGEASRGTYETGALAALLIVLMALIPIVVLIRYGAKRKVKR